MVGQPGAIARLPDGRRFVALDSLRGVAACLVVLLHLGSNGLLTGSVLVTHGWLAVDFFFVLSGFVIAANYGDRLGQGYPLGKYMWLRLGRVWPLHLAVLLAAVALEAGSLFVDVQALTGREPFAGTHSPRDLLLSAFLLQIWQGEGGNGWNVQSWSISGEVFLYALFGLGWCLGRRACLALAVIVAAAAGAIELLEWDLNDYVVRALLGFALGALVWEVHRHRAASPASGPAATSLEALVIALCVLALLFYPRVNLAFCDLAFALAVLVFARDAGWLSRVLARPFPVLLGTVSYSIYMIHPLVVGRIFDALELYGRWSGQALVVHEDGAPRLVAGPWASDLIALASLAAVIVVALASYRWIEAPARNASRRLVGLLPRREPASPLI